MRLLIVFFMGLFVVSCQTLFERKSPQAPIKKTTLDEQINPSDQKTSVIETVPLMNNASKSLFNQAQIKYQNNELDAAINALERAYEVQPQSPQISQFMAEIYLHKGDFDQAHYWATLATKNGPSKGKTCEKSWRILALAAAQLGYFTQQENALQYKEQCLVKAPERF